MGYIATTKRPQSLVEINHQYVTIYCEWKGAVVDALHDLGVLTREDCAKDVDYHKYNVPFGKYELDEEYIVEEYMYQGKQFAVIVAHPFTYSFHVGHTSPNS